MDRLFGLEPRWLQAFSDIFKKATSIEKVTIFGSRAQGTHKEFSDIDLCIYGADLSERDAQHIKEELEDLYHPYFIDVLSKNAITDPMLIESIERDEKLIYRKQGC
jgi:uncharacterized protein